MNDSADQSIIGRLLPLVAQHRALGAQFAEIQGWSLPQSYGDWLQEYEHVRQRVGLIDHSARARLRVTGRDRCEFLQGMVSNDVNVPVGAGTYACFLNAKGHLLADMRIYCRPDEYLLDLDPGVGEEIRTKLDFYVIMSDITITDITGDIAVLAVRGPKSANVLGEVLGQSPPELSEYAQWLVSYDGVEIMVVRIGKSGSVGYDVWASPAAAAALWQQLLVAVQSHIGGPVGYAAEEVLRVEDGIPRLGADLDDSTIPQEAGLEQSAVSFTKGCYVGQETVARLDSRGGNVSRRLRGLIIEGDSLPARGSRLFSNTRDVGRITSAVHSPLLHKVIALANIQRGFNDVGTDLHLDDQQKRTASIVELPFSRTPGAKAASISE